jgi:hypothetical protein
MVEDQCHEKLLKNAHHYLAEIRLSIHQAVEFRIVQPKSDVDIPAMVQRIDRSEILVREYQRVIDHLLVTKKHDRDGRLNNRILHQ